MSCPACHNLETRGSRQLPDGRWTHRCGGCGLAYTAHPHLLDVDDEDRMRPRERLLQSDAWHWASKST